MNHMSKSKSLHHNNIKRVARSAHVSLVVSCVSHVKLISDYICTQTVAINMSAMYFINSGSSTPGSNYTPFPSRMRARELCFRAFFLTFSFGLKVRVVAAMFWNVFHPLLSRNHRVN